MPADSGAFIKRVFRKHAALNILALLASVAAPVVCAVLTGAYYGSAGLAIAALCAPLFLASVFFGFMISGGAQIVSSGFIAKDELDKVAEVYGAAVVLTVAADSLVCAALLIFKTPLLTLMAGEISPALSAYYSYFVLYAFFTMLIYLPLFFSRIAGKPGIGVIATVTMSSAGIAASLPLIQFMGIEAIALGQAIGTAAGFTVSMLLLRRHFRFRFPKQLYIKQILTAGSPLGLSRLYTLITTLALNTLFLRYGGSAALAVWGVVSTLNRFVTAFVAGLSQTLVPLAGVFHEEQDATSVRQTVKTAFVYGNVIMLTLGLVLCVFRVQIGAAFGLSGDSGLFILAMPFYAAYIVLLMNTSIFSAYYNASKRLLLANIIPFVQEFAVLCAYMFAALSGITGIWAAFPVSGAVTLAVLALALLAVKRKNADLTVPLLQNRRLERDGKYISFSVAGAPAEASAAAERVSVFCAEHGVSPKQTMLISMSIEEIITLVINNSRKKDLSVSVRLFLLEDMIVLRIRSAGEKFNAIEYYEQNIADDLEKSLEVIGMKYIVEAANVVYYRQTFGVNSLVIIL